MELPKAYDFQASEKQWKEYWEKQHIFTFKKGKNLFSIDTPPPTVSGKMHLGHAFSYAHEDFIARYKRMQGHTVFYPFGTDDNGLPTEKLVEKMKKVRSTKMKPKEFRDLCYKTVKELQPEFIEAWKRIGMSCDFSKSYSTIEPIAQKLSQAYFIDLFEKGLLKHEETPVAWDTYFQTPIAQAEFENIEKTSYFNDVVFTCHGKDLIISTTRPELLPSCVALFHHPDDKRYAGLKGKFATVPLFDYEVPVLSDETVDKEKGTGLMMCCTFGDKEDIEKYHKYNLPLRISITKDGKMNERAGKYEGKPLADARAEIIQDLKKAKLLTKQEKITHNVNVHEKSAREVEYLVAQQWSVRLLDKKEDFIELGNKISWHPKHMQARYTHWIQNLNWDWTLSRQRSFGVPIPVWYEKDTGRIVVASKDQLPVDPLVDKPKGWNGGMLIPETDVLDTWATSSLTPLVAFEKYGAERSLPLDLRPQAHDIIRTWLFYTVVRHDLAFHELPWNHVMISGFVTDPHGKKMSKSKGNVVDPFELLDKYGADVLRFWSAGGKLGDDLPYNEKDFITGKKTVTKLWNSCRFALSHLHDYKPVSHSAIAKQLTWTDLFILDALTQVMQKATKAFESYEYAKALDAVYDFFWQVFCDHYLELIKDKLYNPDKYAQEEIASTKYTLYVTIKTILQLFAPIMPFITEEIYQVYYKQFEKTPSIHQTAWPAWKNILVKASDDSRAAGQNMLRIISAVRKFKSEQKMSLKAELSQVVIETKNTWFKHFLPDIKAVTNAHKVTIGSADTELADDLRITIKQ